MDGRTRGWLALETKELGRRCGAALLSLYSDSGSKHGQAGADTRFSHRVDRISGSGPFELELELELAARQGSVDVATESAPITEICGERTRQMCVLDALGWPRGARDRLVAWRVVSCRTGRAQLSCAVSVEAKQRAREEQTVTDLRGRVRPRCECRRTPDEWKAWQAGR